MEGRRGSMMPTIGGAAADESFKVVILGARETGKTNIVKRMLYNSFSEKYIPTVEDLYTHNSITRGIRYKFDILDTGGGNEFPVMRTLALQSADACIMVYSVTDRDSFEELQNIKDQIFSEKAPDEISVMVLANKCDLTDDWVVKKNEAELKIRIGWDFEFAHVSAKTGDNLGSVLTTLVPPNFLTGISRTCSADQSAPGDHGKRGSIVAELASFSSGTAAAAHGSATNRRRSISDALSRPLAMMNRTSHRRRTVGADGTHK